MWNFASDRDLGSPPLAVREEMASNQRCSAPLTSGTFLASAFIVASVLSVSHLSREEGLWRTNGGGWSRPKGIGAGLLGWVTRNQAQVLGYGMNLCGRWEGMRGRDITLPRGLSGRGGDRTGGRNWRPPRRSLAVCSRACPPGGGTKNSPLRSGLDINEKNRS